MAQLKEIKWPTFLVVELNEFGVLNFLDVEKILHLIHDGERIGFEPLSVEDNQFLCVLVRQPPRQMLRVITGFEAMLAQLTQCPHLSLIHTGRRRPRDHLVERESHGGRVAVRAHVLIPRVGALFGRQYDDYHPTIW